MKTAPRRMGMLLRPSVIVRCVSILFVIGLVGVLVVEHSSSAFSGTRAISPKVAAGSVTLSYDQVATTDDNITGIFPGEAVKRCVLITYAGNANTTRLDSVRFYGAYDSSQRKNLGSYITYRTDVGTKGSTCDSFVSGRNFSSTFDDYVSNDANYDNGNDTRWTPAAGDLSRAFTLTYTLSDTSDDEAQGNSARVITTWEVRSQANGTAVR